MDVRVGLWIAYNEVFCFLEWQQCQLLYGLCSELVVFSRTRLYLFGSFGLNIGLKLAFVVTKFPQMLRAERDYKPVPLQVHACQI